MSARAIFLDRDGTIIEDSGYLFEPDSVRLLPNAAEGLARLKLAGFQLVLVSNQSGIARGIFDEAALARVHSRLEALLAERGVRLDAAYYCPFLAGPDASVETYRRESPLRKPGPGMLLQAAGELGLDLSQSWMIGNAATDVLAGNAAGCRTIRLEPSPQPGTHGEFAVSHRPIPASSGATPAFSAGEAAGTWVARDLLDASAIILHGAEERT